MIYVSNVISYSMLKQLVKGNTIEVGEEYNIDYLNTLNPDSYKVCIHNPSLQRTLTNRGYISGEVENARVISLVPGDILLAISPSEKIDQYKNEEELPENITFKLEEFIINAY